MVLLSAIKVSVKGMSAHSSEPESGHNAIAHLAEVFKGIELENNSDGQAIEFINQLIGLDLYGKQFGDIAYEHDFMGPMTVSPTVLKRDGNEITLSVNLRRPVGKDEAVLRTQIDTALSNWQVRNNVKLSGKFKRYASDYWHAYVARQRTSCSSITRYF